MSLRESGALVFEAECKGVLPLLSFATISAPCSNKANTHSGESLPFIDVLIPSLPPSLPQEALCKGVLPNSSG